MPGEEKMRKQKKARRSLPKSAGRIITLSLIMVILTEGAGLTAWSGQPVQGVNAVAAVSAEAAVRPSGKAAFVDTADPAVLSAEKKDADQSILDKIKRKLPDIDLPDFDISKIDAKEEKEKLREAVREMDEIGISPERLVERAWKFLNRKDNREKIDEAVEGIRDRVQDRTEKAAGQEK